MKVKKRNSLANSHLATVHLPKVKLDIFIEGKSAASFCHQVAALVPAMFCKFYLVKNHKIADKSAIAEAREKHIF
jgi:hypothetical protein